MRHLEGMSLNQFPGASVLVTTLRVHCFHLPFMALPLCKEQFKAAINRAKTLKTIPFFLNCNEIPDEFWEWADVPVVRTRTPADRRSLPSAAPSSRSRTSLPKWLVGGVFPCSPAALEHQKMVT